MNSKSPFVGIQAGAHSVFDEGPERMLEIMNDTARVNAVFVYSHTYHPVRRAYPHGPSHGLPDSKPSGKPLTCNWVTPHEEYYTGTTLRHWRDPAKREFDDRDVLAELIPVAKEKGVKVYARALEGVGPHMLEAVHNFDKVQSEDLRGRKLPRACWNHPEYRRWWLATVEDMTRSYDLDGFMFGPERGGPLGPLLFHGQDVGCFCGHCVAAAERRGVDSKRARKGFEELIAMVGSPSPERPVDGFFGSILRVWMKYPEVLAWDYGQHLAKESLMAEIYRLAKGIKPRLRVGWHIAHYIVTWDLFQRAEMNYTDIASYADFIKPCVYFNVAGSRLASWEDDARRRILGDLDPATAHAWMTRTFGFDPAQEPALAELATRPYSQDYVRREVRRCVAQSGEVPVYAGIGIDLPGSGNVMASPEETKAAVRAAFEAGAQGLILSREYDEMRLESLSAVGSAIASLPKPL